MRNFPSEFIARKNKIVNPNAWVWLFQIQMDKASDDGFFITNNNVCVTFNGDDYDPYPIRISELPADLEGTTPKVTLTISDVLQQFIAFLEPGAGLVGNQVIMKLTNLEDPFTDSYDEQMIIDEVSIGDTEVSITCSHFAINDRKFPRVEYIKDFCHWEFTGAECGVDPSVPNPGETCTKRLDGAFGCRDWGDKEVALSFPRQHPLRFGSFPSLPTGRVFEV